MGKCDRVRMCAGMLLTVTALCTALLTLCAGDNAAAAFAGRGEQTAVSTEAAGPLAGLTIAVDAGHGGYDGGAFGRVSGVAEKELNLDVAKRVEALLSEQGAKVVMTRTGDYALCDEDPPIRKKLQDMHG